MQEKDLLAGELERSRSEILQLAERVKRLVGKRSERDALLQQLHRTAAMPTAALPRHVAPHHLCSLCATEYAALAIEHVRGCAPGAKCDQCGQPAIMWIQLKPDAEVEGELVPQ